MADITKYLLLKQSGASPRMICIAIQNDIHNPIACIKTLRQVLDISIVEAKRILLSISDPSKTLEEKQALYLAPLQRLLTPLQAEQVRMIIEQLEEVRHRPSRYIGPHIDGILSFISGFDTALELFGISKQSVLDPYSALLEHVVTERGWEWSTKDITHIMYELGYSYTAIVQERLSIEIAIWKRILETSK